MASSDENKSKKAETNQTLALIDPVYQKYVKSVIRALGSSQFYEYFMDSVAHAQNEFQFSNRRMEKIVDTTWALWWPQERPVPMRVARGPPGIPHPSMAG